MEFVAMSTANKYLWSGMSSPLGMCQGGVRLGHMVDLFLAFEGPTN